MCAVLLHRFLSLTTSSMKFFCCWSLLYRTAFCQTAMSNQSAPDQFTGTLSFFFKHSYLDRETSLILRNIAGKPSHLLTKVTPHILLHTAVVSCQHPTSPPPFCAWAKKHACDWYIRSHSHVHVNSCSVRLPLCLHLCITVCLNLFFLQSFENAAHYCAHSGIVLYKKRDVTLHGTVCASHTSPLCWWNLFQWWRVERSETIFESITKICFVAQTVKYRYSEGKLCFTVSVLWVIYVSFTCVKVFDG